MNKIKFDNILNTEFSFVYILIMFNFKNKGKFQFLNLSTIGILRQDNSLAGKWGGGSLCPVHYKIISTIPPGLYVQDANNTLSSCGNQKCL